MTSVDDLFFLARAQLDSGFCADALATAKSMIKLSPTLTPEQRNYFGEFYRQVINPIRHSLRELTRALVYETKQNHALIVDKILHYKALSLAELEATCSEGAALIDEVLLPNAIDDGSRVFYLRMRGDMYRYINEYADTAVRDKPLESYSQALAIAKRSLEPTNPLRLQVFLNYSVFLYEHLADADAAIQILRDALAGTTTDELKQVDEEVRDEVVGLVICINTQLERWLEEQSMSEEEDEEEV